MPPKRKAAGTHVSSKRGKQDTKNTTDNPTNDDIDGEDLSRLSFHWEWANENDEWTSYSNDNQCLINDFLESKDKHLEIKVEGDPNPYALDLNNMVQKHKRSKVEHQIRCWAKYQNNKNWSLWNWRDADDEEASEHYYSAENTMHLESALKKNINNFTLKIGRKKYNIDLENLTQTAASKDADTYEIKHLEKPSLETKTGSKSKKMQVEEKNENNKKDAEVKSAHTKKAPVDSECKEKIGKAHVFIEDDDVFDVMLNQTNLQFNNNKYYLIQLLEDNKAPTYSVWMRWGRVGKKGQNSLTNCGKDLEKAKSVFKAKFSDKTKNKWEERHEFVKVPGKYDLLQMDYSDVPDSKEVIPKKPTSIPDSKLDIKVKLLIEMICDIQKMEEAVLEMKYDTKKAPLGKLTTDQIKAGYTALKQIEDLVIKSVKGKELVQACNDFYTRIPHDFGMRPPALINNLSEIRMKLQLLEALGDIQVAIKLMNEDCDWDLNPVDRHYKSLECNLTPLEKSNKDYKIIEQYIINTHGKTHNQYTLEIDTIFACEKKNDPERFKDCGNRMLLWHGSRLTNWVGILRQGLRVAPPEAPVTGYMFGKGIYFADVCSKSANYCYATRTKNVGLLLLCEVSLGTCNELLDSDYNGHKLPKGKHSVMGLGRVMPNPDEAVKLSDGTLVPLGTLKDSNIQNPNGYTLNYNEYVVYDPKQVQMRYLVKVKFNFK